MSLGPFDFSADSVTPWKPRTIPLIVQIEENEETKAVEKKKRPLLAHAVDTMESMKGEDEEGNEAKSAERLAFFLMGLPLITFSLGQLIIELSKISPLFPKALADVGKGMLAFSDGLPKIVVAVLSKILYEWPKFFFITFVLPVLKVINQHLIIPVVHLIQKVSEVVEKIVIRPLLNIASKAFEAVSVFVPWVIDKVITPPLSFIVKGAVKVVETAVAMAKVVILPIINITQVVGQWLFDKILVPVGKFAGRQLKKVGNAISKAANYVADKALKPLMRAVVFVGDMLSKGFSWVASEIVWPVVEKAMTMVKATAEWVNSTFVVPTVAMIQKVFAPVKTFVKGLMRKFLGFFGSKGKKAESKSA